MTLAECPFDSMTLPQRVLWFATCGCGPGEIADWLQLPEREVRALISRADYAYDPMRRPV